MQHLVWTSLSAREREAALARPAQRRDGAVVETVRRIFEEVERDGESAVARWSNAIDGRPGDVLELTSQVVDGARGALAGDDLKAIALAVDNVSYYHQATAPKPEIVETAPGVRCTRLWRAIASCGLYVPAGTAPLVSTLIMLAAPARAAGVANQVLVSPVKRDGQTHPALIVAAALCGVERIHRLGGAQAIAALTFGVGLAKADKIFGPGNAYVAEAKRYAASLANGPAIDLPAGPSELMVVADAGADPALVAADLLSQAEHDSDAQVVLVSTSAELIGRVQQELERQVASLPRVEIARAALTHARAIEVADLDQAVEVVNAYGPEHASLQVGRPQPVIDAIQNAGAVFVGAYSAETFGDYLAGPSHVLPTDGAAKTWGGVTTTSFMKSISVQHLDGEGARQLGRATARLARLEGLEAHARAAEARLGRNDDALAGPVIRRRRAELVRQTKETKIAVTVDLDKQTPPNIATGVGFYDHMLAQVAQHGGFELSLSCQGDLEIDAHHTIEDCALAFGQALKQALGERRGIARFGFLLPMDETEAKVSIDLGGRPYLVFAGAFEAPLLGAYPTEMTEHVFRSLSQAMGASIHVAVEGDNDHHKTEACFKAFGRALRQAIAIESDTIASTKGVIE
jgi:histidinol dehydrogenase